MSRSRVLLLALVCVLASAAICLADQSGDLEGFDEQEAPARAKAGGQTEKRTHADIVGGGQGGPVPDETPRTISGAFKKAIDDFKIENYYYEVASLACILIYVAVIVGGVHENKEIGKAWAAMYAVPGSVFDRNFSHCGISGTAGAGVQLMRESASLFKFYASGRRYCQGMLAELQLINRQDALSMIWQLLSPSEDTLQLDVYMQEASMPPIVLAIATPKCARNMQRDLSDIKRFTKKINIGKEVSPSWPGEKLWVLAEHSSIFQDLIGSDPKLQQLFASAADKGSCMRYFRSMHFTSESSEGTHKQLLRFVFKLPPRDQMGAISKLIDLVPMFIDIVGTYKLSPEMKKKATDARAKAAEDDEEARKKRQEALAQKKEEKAAAERARLMRMNPEARQKAEDKLRAKEMKKALSKRAIKS